MAHDDPGQIYDRAFFSEYGLANPVYTRSCTIIAEEIARRFQPRSLVDWGCGSGLHLDAFGQLGLEAIGVDASTCPEDLRPAGLDIRSADLRQKSPEDLVPSSYDLSLCLDVLEHIDAEDSPQVLKNIVQGAQLLLLSCAPPGQGGHHHVNEQPRRYWVKRLAELGWIYQRRETGEMERSFLDRRDALSLSWMYHNICVYRPAA